MQSIPWYLIIIFSQTSISIANILSNHFTIHAATIFSTSQNDSLLAVHQFSTSTTVRVTDCAHQCLASRLCKIAVLNMQTKLCMMHQQSSSISGQLLPGLSTDFTMINVDRSAPQLLSIDNNTIVYAIWNTTAGQNSLPSSRGTSTGRYWYNNAPGNIFDSNWTTVICSYGPCNISLYGNNCGVNTGFYFSLPFPSLILREFRIVSAQYRSRDPMTLTIEGSNHDASVLTLGSSWTLIYNGTTGFNTNPGRYLPGSRITIGINQTPYINYRFLFTSLFSTDTCLELSELELYGLL